MHRLFWKIFVSFWIALILFSAATMYAASQFVDHVRARQEATTLHDRMLQYAAEGQRIADESGVTGLRAWLHDLDRRELVPLLLVNRGGVDLLQRPLTPAAITRLQRELAQPSRPAVKVPNHGAYLLIPDFQSVTLARLLGRPRVIILPLVLAAIVSGLMCFALARYLTSPIGRFQRATEAYAAGRLSERVAPTLGGRRDEIADFARAFDHMAQRLQELMASQRQLLNDVSHELRSPLARLQVALGLARQRAEGRAEAEFDRIERETERLNDLIGQILSLARLDAGVLPAASEPVDIAELVSSVAADANFEARSGNRRVEIERSIPAVIQGDAGLLHSALENIVRNAVRYTAADTSVVLSLDRQQKQRDCLQIGIRDHGPGVPEDFLPRLFEPFVRVDDARDRSSGGFGLGLAIASKAIQAHGGNIRAMNNPGGGLTVMISLPLATPTNSPATLPGDS